jgi:hypothetical protein
MILRVYAMWNKSKRILYILLFIYVPQGIVSLCLSRYLPHSQYLPLRYVSVKLQAKIYMWSFVSYHLFLQSELSKLLISLLAILH